MTRVKKIHIIITGGGKSVVGDLGDEILAILNMPVFAQYSDCPLFLPETFKK